MAAINFEDFEDLVNPVVKITAGMPIFYGTTRREALTCPFLDTGIERKLVGDNVENHRWFGTVETADLYAKGTGVIWRYTFKKDCRLINIGSTEFLRHFCEFSTAVISAIDTKAKTVTASIFELLYLYQLLITNICLGIKPLQTARFFIERKDYLYQLVTNQIFADQYILSLNITTHLQNIKNTYQSVLEWATLTAEQTFIDTCEIAIRKSEYGLDNIMVDMICQFLSKWKHYTWNQTYFERYPEICGYINYSYKNFHSEICLFGNTDIYNVYSRVALYINYIIPTFRIDKSNLSMALYKTKPLSDYGTCKKGVLYTGKKNKKSRSNKRK